MDLADPDTLRRTMEAQRPDVLINAAAYTAVDRAEDEPDSARAANALAPGILAEAAAALGVPMIQMSTDYVFDGSADRPYRESDSVGPIGVYGKTKNSGEKAVRAAGGEYAIVRTAWVYSPFGQNFVRTMLRLAGERDEVTVVGDQVGSPTSALEIAHGLYALIETWRVTGEWPCGTFHLAGEGEASWAQLASHLLATSARLGGPVAEVRAITTSDWPTRAARPANSRLDSRAFERATGYRAPKWTLSVDEVVERLLQERTKV